MSCRFITMRATDRLPGEEADRAGVVDGLCAFLVAEARKAGATGAALEDVHFCKADDGGVLVTVAIRIRNAAGFDGIDAAGCRAFVDGRRVAAAQE